MEGKRKPGRPRKSNDEFAQMRGVRMPDPLYRRIMAELGGVSFSAWMRAAAEVRLADIEDRRKIAELMRAHSRAH